MDEARLAGDTPPPGRCFLSNHPSILNAAQKYLIERKVQHRPANIHGAIVKGRFYVILLSIRYQILINLCAQRNYNSRPIDRPIPKLV